MTEQQPTRAEIKTPSFMPAVNVAPSTEGAITVGGALTIIVGVILHFRRKASRDGNEIVKDRTESELFRNMIQDREGVLRERDAAREAERTAWTKHNEVAVENARLKAENMYQQQEIARLTEAMKQLQVQFDEIKERLQRLASGATGHSGMGDLRKADGLPLTP